MKLTRDGSTLVLFDAKYPFIRRKRKFGTVPVRCPPSEPGASRAWSGVGSCVRRVCHCLFTALSIVASPVCVVWRTEDVTFLVKSITCVEPGLPLNFKKKMFGKTPVPERCVCVKEGGTYVCAAGWACSHRACILVNFLRAVRLTHLRVHALPLAAPHACRVCTAFNRTFTSEMSCHG